MHICIVGGGTGGLVTAMTLVSRGYEWTKIDIIYDPNIPIIGVGETLGHDFVQLLRGSTQFLFPFDLEELNAKIKQGIFFVDWNEFQNFPNNLGGYITLSCQGLHIDTFSLRDFVLSRLNHYWSHKFKEIHANVKHIYQSEDAAYIVTDTETLEYDYVVDCRGVPKTLDETYEQPTTIPVDSAVLNICDKPGDWDYTYHLAHKDGWMFGVPVHHRSTWGYLFNRDITSSEDAIKNCHEFLHTHRIPKQHIDYSKLRENIKVITWDHYHSKKPVDNRILRNGNSLFNYEPLHGYAVPLYTFMAGSYIDYFTHAWSEEQVNQQFHAYLNSFQDLIAFHYHKGSIHDTPFWRWASKISQEKLEGSEWMRICMSENFTLEGAIRLDDTWTTSPIAHPMFIWEIDRAFNFGYFKHLPNHHAMQGTCA